MNELPQGSSLDFILRRQLISAKEYEEMEWRVLFGKVTREFADKVYEETYRAAREVNSI